MQIKFSKKYKPLFQLLTGKYPEVDTVILTGGRGSAKSFVIACLALTALVYHAWNVLYTRFTNVSIIDSIKPEVDDKIELLQLSEYVNSTTSHIEHNGNRIAFKGIKTGSKQQTANLKSLFGFNLFVIDEAEETPDFETFEKVFLSIRSKDKRNITILILNPTTSMHWIYEHFFEKKGVEGGSNLVRDNVMYIHTTYKDVSKEYLAPNILKYYERMQEDEPEKYDQIVGGGWITEPEGVLLPLSKLRFENLSNIPEENIVFKFACGDPADKGGDHFSFPMFHVAIIDNNLACFVKDVIHSRDGIEVVNDRAIEKMRTLFIEESFLEVNGVGVGAYLLLKRDLSNHSKVKPFTSTINKEVRILSHYEFVAKYFIFDENYKNDPEYKLFINHVTSYQKDDDTANKNKKDAIDSLCSAASILKIKYKKILYG